MTPEDNGTGGGEYSCMGGQVRVRFDGTRRRAIEAARNATVEFRVWDLCVIRWKILLCFLGEKNCNNHGHAGAVNASSQSTILYAGAAIKLTTCHQY